MVKRVRKILPKGTSYTLVNTKRVVHDRQPLKGKNRYIFPREFVNQQLSIGNNYLQNLKSYRGNNNKPMPPGFVKTVEKNYQIPIYDKRIENLIEYKKRSELTKLLNKKPLSEVLKIRNDDDFYK